MSVTWQASSFRSVPPVSAPADVLASSALCDQARESSGISLTRSLVSGVRIPFPAALVKRRALCAKRAVYHVADVKGPVASFDRG
ncbi:unnamed protein product [Lampetra planeri]